MLLLALSIAPGIALMIYIYLKDRYEKEPTRLLVKCFFGGMFSIFPVMVLEYIGIMAGFDVSPNSIVTMIYAFAVIGLSEEICKYFFVIKLAYHKEDFNEPFDGIVYSMMVGMGFATLETSCM